MGEAKFWCEKQAVQEFKNRVIKVSNRRGKRKKKSKQAIAIKQFRSENDTGGVPLGHIWFLQWEKFSQH